MGLHGRDHDKHEAFAVATERVLEEVCELFSHQSVSHCITFITAAWTAILPPKAMKAENTPLSSYTEYVPLPSHSPVPQ